MAAFIAGRYFLVFGGYDTSQGESVNDLHILDLAQGGSKAQVFIERMRVRVVA